MRLVQLLTAALCFTATAAQADIDAYFTSDTVFAAVLTGMPDLDQRREGDGWPAAWNDGSMFCGPTSGANVLNYFARHGFPDLDPGPVDLEPNDLSGLSFVAKARAEFQNAQRRVMADDLIADMAGLMGTHAVNGTDWNGVRDGLRAALPDGFRVTHRGQKLCTGTHEVINPRVIYDELEQGHVVILRFGYYDPAGGGRYTRNGGHWVVPIAVVRNGDLRRLWWRDPARDLDVDETDRDTQSGFVSDLSDLQSVRVQAGGCTRKRFQAVDRAPASSAPAGRLTLIEDLVVIAQPGT